MSLFSFNLFLFYLLTENEVKVAIKRYVFNIFQIHEIYIGGPHVPQNNVSNVEQTPQSIVTTSTTTNTRNIFPMSKVIAVSPVSIDSS